MRMKEAIKAVMLLVALSVIAVLNNAKFRVDDRRRLEGQSVEDILPTKLQTEICGHGLRFIVLGKTETPLHSYSRYLCNAEDNLKVGGVPKDWECLRSKIGRNRYDVFVLDFFEVADEHMIDLAIRIRRRFPDALVINLKHFFPNWIGYYEGKNWVNIKEWAKSEVLSEDIVEEFANSTNEWQLKSFEEQNDFYETSTQKSNAWSLYKDNNSSITSDEIKGMLKQKLFMYDSWNSRSIEGDLDVALGIFELVRHSGVKKSENINSWGINDDPPECYLRQE